MSLILLRVFILLTALMVWQAKNAEARCPGHPATYETTAQRAHVASETAASKAEIAPVKSISAASSSQDDTCKDGCGCSMGMCCSAAAILPYSLDTNVAVRDVFEASLPELLLPQGPPSSLLRPPRFSA